MSQTPLAKALLLLTLLAACYAPARAQDPDGQSPQRGAQPNTPFAVGGADSISLANGNMSYSVPLASLPLSRGGRLAPAVYLVYNSKLYDTSVRICDSRCSFAYTETNLVRAAEGGWRYGVRYSLRTTNRAVNYLAGPPPNTNIYKFKSSVVFPDGSSHPINPLGYTPQDDYYSVYPGQLASPMTYYSTDGTYFRVIVQPGQASWVISFADGTTVGVNEQTGVQTMTDGNGNSYTVQNVTLANGNPATTVTDQLGRQITLEDAAAGPDYVRAPGYGGAELVTTINWGTAAPQGKRYLWRVYADDVETFKNLSMSHPVVTTINLPNGLSYQFQYNSEVFDPNNPTKSVGWGEMYRATLPTGAIARYSYEMDNKHGEDWHVEPKEVLKDSPWQKQLTYTDSYDGVDTQRIDTWTYAIAYGANDSVVSGQVTGPDGGQARENFFENTGSPSFDKSGLSYKSTRPDGSVVERTWLGNIPYAGAGVTINPYVKTEFTSIPNASGALAKTAIKDYSYDKNGNLTQAVEYDWVNYADVPRDASGKPNGIPASAQIVRVTLNTYHNLTPAATTDYAYSANNYNQASAPNLRAAAESTEVRSGLADTTVLARAEFAYDNPSTTGNLTQEKRWDSAKGAISRPLTTSNWVLTQHAYDSYGNPTLLTDARGYQTQYTYGPVDGAGGPSNLYVTQVKATYLTPVELTTGSTYDLGTGAVKSVTDANGVVTRTTYDSFARPVLVEDADGAPVERQTSTDYSDSLRRVIVRSDLNALGDAKLVSISYYDQLGRVRLSRRLEDAATQSETDETAGVKVQTRYLTSGSNSYRLVSNPYRAVYSNQAGNEQTMGWTRSKSDNGGRLVEVQTFAGSGVPAPWGANSSSTGAVTTAYDAEFTTVTDQAGKVGRSMTDALGRLARVDEPDASGNLGAASSPAQPTSYAYDALGSLRQVIQGAQTRTFNYGSLSRLTSATNPESGTASYSYDNNGNLSAKTDARNVTTTYAYDALNRNTTVDYSNTAVNPDVERHYDNPTTGAYGRGRFYYSYAGGNYSVGSDVEHTAIDAYDALGRPLTQRQLFKTSGAWGATYQTSSVYNRAGFVTSQTYPSGHTISYTPDAAGRLASFTGNLGDGAQRTYSSNVTYDEASRVREERFGTDTPLYHKLHYNVRGQLNDIRLSTVASAAGEWDWNRGALLLSYSQSEINAATNAARSASGPENNGNLKRGDVYVPLDAAANYDGVNAPGAYYTAQQSYSYDPLNRLSSINEANNAGASPVSQAYTYDRWGNRQINAAGTSAGINSRQFTIDTATNRLTASGMAYDNAGNLTQDTYSALASQRVYDAENRMTLEQNSVTSIFSRYAYDADGHRARRDVGGQVTWQVYGFDGELLAEYAGGALPASPQKEYGYRGGELLVAAEAGGGSQTNLALGKTATQSSEGWGGTPSRAVDGNTSGNWGDSSTTHTNSDYQAWWQVDLGSVQPINSIKVWNRTDCCGERLYDSYVLVSDAPFTSTDLTATLNQAGASNYYTPGQTGTPTTLTVNRTGRYVRVQLTGTNFLSLAEVQIMSVAGGGGAGVQWLVADHLGTPRMTVDQTGSLAGVKRHDYLPFGEEVGVGVGGRTEGQGYVYGVRDDGMRQKFTDKERDAETGMDYFGARYYAGMQGRFTSVDPYDVNIERQYAESDKVANDILIQYITNPQHWNKYAYVLNNPLNLIDPTGENEEEIVLKLNIIYDARTIKTKERAEELTRAAIDHAKKTLATVGIWLEVTFKEGSFTAQSGNLADVLTGSKVPVHYDPKSLETGALNVFVSEDRNQSTGGFNTDNGLIFLNYGRGDTGPRDLEEGRLSHEIAHKLGKNVGLDDGVFNELYIDGEIDLLHQGNRHEIVYRSVTASRNPTHILRATGFRDRKIVQIFREGALRVKQGLQ
jgi:RHS repeat-associated protein